MYRFPVRRGLSSIFPSTSLCSSRNRLTFPGTVGATRFFAVKARAALHVQPIELGPPPAGEDPY
jgi:hypothetical protein